MNRVTAVVIAILVAAALIRAQAPEPAGRNAASEASNVRFQVGIMERVLEQAVQHGAEELAREMTMSTPDMLMFTGPARARGFKLDGYGIFFDVEVPTLRQSLMWSMQRLSQDFDLSEAIESLREHVKSIQNAQQRSSLEQALRRLELQVGPAQPAVAARTAASPEARESVREEARADKARIMKNPADAYTSEVQRALINAMLDHSAPMGLAADDWLTVAARAADDTLVPDGRRDLTMFLRVRGRDLAAFRAERLSRDEAIKRVEVGKF